LNINSFDIEILEEIPDGDIRDLSAIIPSVAATCVDETNVKFWYDEPYMTKETAKKLVLDLMNNYKNGIPVFGWNICAFDLPILGYYSEMLEECGELALNGIDPMLYIVFNKGYFLGLDAALVGAGLETKTHKVQLKNGEWLEDMNGRLAPKLWQNGEYEAVKTYLHGDVVQPLKLANSIEINHGIRWFSKAGNPMYVYQKTVPVKDLFSLPMPDTSWMTRKPKERKEFVSWIPKEVRERNGVFCD
jgi:hypothetical protein